MVELINEDDLARRATFPENVEIREIACHLAAKVFEQAAHEGLQVKYVHYKKLAQIDFQVANKDMLEAYEEGDLPKLKTYIYSKMWYPNYRPLVYLPPGKGE